MIADYKKTSRKRWAGAMLLLTVLACVVLTNAYVAKADFEFGEPVNLGPTVNSPDYGDCNPLISRNGLELYFMSRRPGGYGGPDIWVSKRASVDDPWGPAVNLGPKVNTANDEYPMSLSSDGLNLYGCSAGTGGTAALYMFTRPTIDAPWDSRLMMSPVLNSAFDSNPVISPDDLELYFYSIRSGGLGGADIYVSTRATRNDPWGPPVSLGPTINTAAHESPMWLSPDGLVLFIGSNRSGGFGGFDGYMICRPSKGAPWSAPVNLGPSFNTPNDEALYSVSPDGRWAYLDDLGRGHLWMAPILPIVDFNGDGVVDIADVGIMVEHWHTDYSLCDIGPMPWGDGFVDAQDLAVLAEYLSEGSRPIANWKLDEDQGSIAYDSARQNDAALHGGPLWQPSGGKKGGALQFDGANDYVSTPFILDPAKGSFSVFAWVKTSGRGQVIISQNDATGTRWLWTDPSYGRLTTWLMHPPFDPLMSAASITDGQWHHVGLVYDSIGLKRHLYIDGAEAAKDSVFVGGVSSNGGLYFGADKTLQQGSFFSGLIDDVRIYDEALSAEEVAELAR